MTFEELKKEVLSDPEVKKEYDALEPEFQLILAMLELRSKQNLTQQELADRTGINRSDISKIENGNANPSLKTMKRLAAAMGKRVHISFV
ncbi:MAG: helix-turn-helix transcriptional regulator [Spirochaetales bacterium]|jgi:DNA-binding XRE family transcriptional regulator|nr:helix-turn-helix transcriptional regulator [Spirochaetales bacterium]